MTSHVGETCLQQGGANPQSGRGGRHCPNPPPSGSAIGAILGKHTCRPDHRVATESGEPAGLGILLARNDHLLEPLVGAQDLPSNGTGDRGMDPADYKRWRHRYQAIGAVFGRQLGTHDSAWYTMTLAAVAFGLFSAPTMTAIASFPPYLTIDEARLTKVNAAVETAGMAALISGSAIGAAQPCCQWTGSSTSTPSPRSSQWRR
jgi:hypothetical protein